MAGCHSAETPGTTLESPESLMYDPRLRPALPIVVGVEILLALIGAFTVRRPHVRAATLRFSSKKHSARASKW